MKNIKRLLSFLAILSIFPINVFAYSDYIIPGGESVGIEISSDGIMVVGFYKVNGKYNKGTPKIEIGDKILEVNGKHINTIEEMIDEMEKDSKKGYSNITISRDNKKKEVKLELIEDGTTYKTGLYVKDSITGLGSITYIDPETLIYGALGHNILEANTNRLVEVRDGSIFRSSITSIDRSVSGTPGGKNAKFFSNQIYGSIDKNMLSGIYGVYTNSLPSKKTLKVAQLEEIEKGPAKIYTVLEGEKVEEFDIKITKIDLNNQNKNIYFDVIDKRLLEKTGGIVQGMSGSPIVQGEKLVGAVSHVVVSNPSSGYGISIIKMLEDGEK